MPRQSTKKILAALKSAGVNLGDDRDAVTEALENIELSAEEFLSGDQMILTKAEHLEPQRELKDDLNKAKARARTAEQGEKEAKAGMQELRDMVDSGDSDNARKVRMYKTKLDELEPMVKTLVDRQRKDWEHASKHIPEKVREMFTFAEEGKELSLDELLQNTSKYDEYTQLGVIDEAAPVDDIEKPEGPPTTPRIQKPTGAKKYTKEQLDTMTPAQMLSAGYKDAPG